MITMAWPNVVSPHKILSPALKFRVEEMYNDSHDENKAKGGFKAAAAQITLLSREKNLNNIKRSFQAFSLKKRRQAAVTLIFSTYKMFIIQTIVFITYFFQGRKMYYVQLHTYTY